MPRIPFPTPDTMTPEQRKVYDAVASGPRGKVQGPLLAALHRPELADKWQQLGELAVYDYAAELQDRRFVSEESYRRALGLWGVVGVVELTALIGYYTMVAMTLNAHEFPLPAGVEPPFAPLAAQSC